MVFLASTVNGQTIETQDKPEFNGVRPYEVKVQPAYVPLYAISDKKLPSFFKSGEIPASFPKYDAKLEKGPNNRIALEWFLKPENNKLLTDEAKQRIDLKLAEKKAKSNK